MTSGFGSGNQIQEEGLVKRGQNAIQSSLKWFFTMLALIIGGYVLTMICYVIVTSGVLLRTEMIRQSQPSTAISIVLEETLPEIWKENLSVTIGSVLGGFSPANDNKVLQVSEATRQVDVVVVHTIANFLIYMIMGLVASRFNRVYSAFIIPVLLMPVTNQLLLSDMYWSGNAASDALFLGTVVGQLLCLYLFCILGRYAWGD